MRAGLSVDAESDLWEAVPISADVQPLHDRGGGEIWGVAGDAEGVVADLEMQSILPWGVRSAVNAGGGGRSEIKSRISLFWA